jgi:hypothetical protein
VKRISENASPMKYAVAPSTLTKHSTASLVIAVTLFTRSAITALQILGSRGT